MAEILKIFYDYSINNKVLSRDAIGKILEIVLNENNLQDKVFYEISKDEIISWQSIWNNNIIAEFDMDTTIYIYYLEIFKSIYKKKYLTKYDTNLNETEHTFKKNAMIIETIFHEVEHAKQLMYIKNIYDGSLETQIYRYEYDFLFSEDSYKNPFAYVKHNYIYQKNYDISFMERMANFNSYEKTSLLLKELGNIYHKLYESEVKMTDDFMLEGYKKSLLGPTLKFIRNIGYYDEFTNSGFIDEINNMPFINRFYYGLPITNEEYKQKVKK